MNAIRLAVIAIALLVAGCAGQQMPVVKPGEALIVFLRPRTLSASAPLQSAGAERPVFLYHVSGAAGEQIGAVGVGEKLAHPLKPGRHRFVMLSGQAGEVLEAEVLAGRTYYSLITQDVPRLGRSIMPVHSIRAVRRSELDGPDFSHWLRQTMLATPPGSVQKPSARTERQLGRYSQQWSFRSPAQRTAGTLLATDGR